MVLYAIGKYQQLTAIRVSNLVSWFISHFGVSEEVFYIVCSSEFSGRESIVSKVRDNDCRF